MVVPKIVKPKTQRGKRFLENREPKVIENVKRAMFVKGGRTNEIVTTALKQFCLLKKPFSQMLTKKNIMRPFDDSTPLEYLTQKNDHSLFMFGCHSKKRPNDLIIGRMFDAHVSDMFEFGIEKFIPMNEFKGSKITMGIKPCLVFEGELFETDPEYQRLKCLLLDFFRGEVIENVRLTGFEHVLSFSSIEDKVHVRSYRVNLKKSATKVPTVELEEMGPSMDLVKRRSKLASDDLYKKSKKQPKEISTKKPKNISYDGFGSKLGRIHMEKQDLSKLQVRKMKGLKRKHAKKTETETTNEKKAKTDTDNDLTENSNKNETLVE